MRRILFLLAAACCACCTPDNQPVDRFAWEIQTSGYDLAASDFRGETDAARFRRQIREFPWRERGMEGRTSTLAVTDLLTDRTLFVSSNSDYGFTVGCISPDRKQLLGIPRRIRTADVCRMAIMPEVEKLAEGFFSRDGELLDSLLSKGHGRVQSPESASWGRYLAKKRNYLKKAE